MVRFGLDVFLEKFPAELKGKTVGVVCHAASINSSYSHIIEILKKSPECRLGAIFGPQHGLFGQTQDNMIEWEAKNCSEREIPVYSLYGKVRAPTKEMINGLDGLIFDVQDIGARPYTFVWTLKNCMEVCCQYGLPIWVLDRPNPVGALPFDGPILSPEHFSFVGGAQIPLCHRLTMGEMALLLKKVYFPSVNLSVVWMDGWWRNSIWTDTALPWVLPSPNMPTVDTALVYPGMVLLEATNLSEGRGTTRPFELFGAPWIDMNKFKKILFESEIGGCTFREHHFIPTFQKWANTYCNGMQIHVTNPQLYFPVRSAVAILRAAIDSSNGEFNFKDPPYEYEQTIMPFDILSGDSSLRNGLKEKVPLSEIFSKWEQQYSSFIKIFQEVAYYPEEIG